MTCRRPIATIIIMCAPRTRVTTLRAAHSRPLRATTTTRVQPTRALIISVGASTPRLSASRRPSASCLSAHQLRASVNNLVLPIVMTITRAQSTFAWRSWGACINHWSATTTTRAQRTHAVQLLAAFILRAIAQLRPLVMSHRRQVRHHTGSDDLSGSDDDSRPDDSSGRNHARTHYDARTYYDPRTHYDAGTDFKCYSF